MLCVCAQLGTYLEPSPHAEQRDKGHSTGATTLKQRFSHFGNPVLSANSNSDRFHMHRIWQKPCTVTYCVINGDRHRKLNAILSTVVVMINKEVNIIYNDNNTNNVNEFVLKHHY